MSRSFLPALLVASLFVAGLAATGCDERRSPPPAEAPSKPVASVSASAPGELAALASSLVDRSSSPPVAAASASTSASAASGATPTASAMVASPATSSKRGEGKKLGAGISTPTVQLLSPGAEPRTALRYVFAKDRVERVRLATRTTVKTEIDGVAGPSPATPEVEAIAKLTVLELLPNHEAKREVSFEKLRILPSPELDASTLAQLEKRLAGYDKLRGYDRIDDRGMLRDVRLDASAVEAPELRALVDGLAQSFGQLGAPFPEEAVGVGAKWKVRSKVAAGGVDVQQESTYELTELEGKKGRLRIEINQSAPRAKMNPPGLPPGARAELMKLSANGKGSVAFDLARAMPEGAVDSESRLVMRTTLAGRQQDVTILSAVAVKFVPLD